MAGLLNGVPRSQRELTNVVSAFDDIEAVRFVYSLMLGDVFSRIALLEDAFITALWSSRKIKIPNAPSAPKKADDIMRKRDILAGMTFGNLIRVLKRHSTRDCDISYLNYVKDKRDYFIHKFFSDNPAPGDLRYDQSEVVFRRLRFLDLTFWRASRRVWLILGYNDFSIITDLGSAGILAMNDLSERE